MTLNEQLRFYQGIRIKEPKKPQIITAEGGEWLTTFSLLNPKSVKEQY
jgi:hypothetical protein